MTKDLKTTSKTSKLRRVNCADEVMKKIDLGQIEDFQITMSDMQVVK